MAKIIVRRISPKPSLIHLRGNRVLADAPLLLCVFIIITSINSSLGSSSYDGCYMPDDLSEALTGALRYKLNPIKNPITPKINLDRFQGPEECPRKMKSIALKVDTLTSASNNFSEGIFTLLLKEIDDFEKISSFVIHSTLEELKTLLTNLRRLSLDRKLADLVISGNLEDAKAILENTNYASFQVELLEKLMKNLYDKKFQQKAIRFANNVGYLDLTLAGFKILLSEMKQNSQMENVDVFSIQHYISKTILDNKFASPKQTSDYLELQTELNVHVEKIILGLVAEIDQETYRKRNDLAERIGEDVLNTYLPEIIRKYYKGGDFLTKAKKLLRYLAAGSIFPSSIICVAEEALYNEMKKDNGQLTSFVAFNHWLYVKKTIKELNAQNLIDAKCQKVYEALEKNANQSICQFISVFNSEDWSNITKWIQEFPYTLKWILPAVVPETYKGVWQKIKNIEKLVKKINSLDANCIGYGTLLSEMNRLDKFGTFETLLIYEKVKSTLGEYVPSKDTQDAHKFCERAKEIAPAWIKNLVFQNTSRCTIKNKGDSKMLAENDASSSNNIILKSSGGEETMWKVEVAENGLVSFVNIRYSNFYISLTEDEDDVQSSSSDKFQWRVEGSSTNGYVQIHAFDQSRDDFYFVTNKVETCKNGGLTCVQVKKRKDCGERCEWKIDC